MAWKVSGYSGLALAALLFAVRPLGFTGAGPGADGVRSRQGAPAAVILTPQEGDTTRGSVVQIELAVENIVLRPAGTNEAGTGHLHLFIDRDITPEGEVIPSGPGIVHLGKAQVEYLLKNIGPGDHTIIAVLGDYLHVRIPGARTDTVHITATPESQASAVRPGSRGRRRAGHTGTYG